MSSATKPVAASSAMLPLVTAQTVAFERGSEDGFRDEEHLAGKAPESVNHELIFQQISRLGAPATRSMTFSSHEKSGCTLMPNSNDAASNEMLWEQVLSLLVVGASMLGGSAVLLIQALPPILH